MSNNEWETPKDLFAELYKVFNFTWDVCATDENALLDGYWTVDEDALSQPWHSDYMYYMNPPYSKDIAQFLKKAHDETIYNGANIVVLIPANVGTHYFQDYCFDNKAVQSIYFIDGRLKYTLNGKPVGSPRFDSCIVIFAPSSDPIEFYTCNRQFGEIRRL